MVSDTVPSPRVPPLHLLLSSCQKYTVQGMCRVAVISSRLSTAVTILWYKNNHQNIACKKKEYCLSDLCWEQSIHYFYAVTRSPSDFHYYLQWQGKWRLRENKQALVIIEPGNAEPAWHLGLFTVWAPCTEYIDRAFRDRKLKARMVALSCNPKGLRSRQWDGALSQKPKQK